MASTANSVSRALPFPLSKTENYFQESDPTPAIPFPENQMEFQTSYQSKATDLNTRGYISDSIYIAIMSGETDANELANRIFYSNHPELVVKRRRIPLSKDSPRALKKEWSGIFYSVILPIFIWPPKPDHLRINTDDERIKTFGEFSYVPAPTEKEPRAIRMTDNWESKNMDSVEIPQLVGKINSYKKIITKGTKVNFHSAGIKQLKELWDAWEAAGLIDRIISWDGSFNARFIKGTTRLSNHSWGTAFDINGYWNDRSTQPAPIGKLGCTMELVRIANAHGFYWGGYFGGSSTDGMHFELGKVI